jgi:5-enolpyruvylshikimate-3-phosphate synthase
LSNIIAGHLEQLTLQPIDKIEGHVKLPGSKSLSNRILLLAALSKGTTTVKNLLVSTIASSELCHVQSRSAQ